MGVLGLVFRRATGVAVAAATTAAVSAAAQYASSRRINAAERLGDALLDTSRLSEASGYAAAEPEAALAACAAYLIGTAQLAANGMSGPPALDPIGFERKCTRAGDTAVATVVTTGHEPESRWRFDVDAPGVARVSGSRRLTAARLMGPRTVMRTPDSVSMRFENGYSANIESDMEFATGLLPGVGPRTLVHGTASLSDNRGNVGRVQIAPGGEVTGTITRGPDIVGRFEGSLQKGLTFHQRVLPT